MRLLEPFVNSQSEIRRVTDAKSRAWFEQRSGKEEAEEHQEIDSQKTTDSRPDEAPPRTEVISFRGGLLLGFGCLGQVLLRRGCRGGRCGISWSRPGC
jgi:hypothetical protein